MRILLAEDERTISRLIRQVLTRAGHDVTGVQTCGEALTELRGGDFDLILLDMNLADGDGMRIVEEMAKRQQERPPIVLMTGERRFDDEDPRLRQVEGVLWKPFELDELEAAVARFSA
jgi:DNA-binding response OmpR family regulator